MASMNTVLSYGPCSTNADTIIKICDH